jgi:hypothetical protein
MANVNDSICKQEKLTNNLQYRKYLQNNGESIKTYNLSITQQETAARFPNSPFGYVVGTPYFYTTPNSPQAPKYESSDLKESYFKTGRV